MPRIMGMTPFLDKIAENPRDHLPLHALSDFVEENGLDPHLHQLIRHVLHHNPDAEVKIGDKAYYDPQDESSYLPVNRHWDDPTSSGLLLYSKKHKLFIPHKDPTFKLIREYRKSQPDKARALSKAEAKKLGVGDKWEEAHRVLSQIAFEQFHFGRRSVGESMMKLLKKRGLFKTKTRTTEDYEMFPEEAPTGYYGKGDYENHDPLRDDVNDIHINRKQRSVWSDSPYSRSAPTRLARQSISNSTVLINLNGVPAGKVIFSNGTPYIDPGLMGLLRKLPAPVPILPMLNPNGFQDLLHSLNSPVLIPGIGLLTTQRLG